MRYGIDSIRTEGDEITVLVGITFDKSELSELLNIQQLVDDILAKAKKIKAKKQAGEEKCMR